MQIAFFNKRRPEVGHDDISDEHHPFVGKINQHALHLIGPARIFESQMQVAKEFLSDVNSKRDTVGCSPAR
jgi:hypothetical protein